MIDFDATVTKAQSFETVGDARKWVITIISDLVDLKQSPGGGLRYKNLVRQIVAPFNHKGKGDFQKEIEGYVKEEENKRTQEKFDAATDDKQRERFDTSDNGVVMATLKNISKVLIGNKFIEFHYDTHTERQFFRFPGDSLWHEGLPKHYLEIKYPHEHELTGLKLNRWYSVDGHLAELKLYLHQFFPEERYWQELKDAVDIACIRNQINIYQDWMDHGLPEWDHKDRMDFLYRYAGVENREWSMVIGHLIFLGLVARCYVPGFDYRGVII